MRGLSSLALDDLDFEKALANELSWRPDLMPEQPADLAVAEVIPEFAKFFESTARHGGRVPVAEVLMASKWKRGRRPVHVMPLYERVLYRAVVDVLAQDLPDLERSSQGYQDFLRSVADEPDVEYVLKTDIANYFASIDHGLLVDEIVSRTGRYALPAFLADFWYAIFERNVGIPQMNQSSNVLSELLVDNVHRNMVRRGFRTWRYADDFRVAASTRSECVRALDAIHEEARVFGLTLNEWKTHTPKIEAYRDMIEENDRRQQEADNNAFAALTLGIYGDIVSEPDTAEVDSQAAATIISDWYARAFEFEEQSSVSYLIEEYRLLRTAIQILGILNDPSAIYHAAALIDYEPQLTPDVCRYLRDLSASHSDEVGDQIVRLAGDISLNRWQHLWMSWLIGESALSLTPVEFPWERTRPELVGFLTARLGDRSELIRNQALLSLSRHRIATRDQWQSVSERSSALGEPYTSAAIPGIADISKRDRDRTISKDKLQKRIAEWSEKREDPPLPPPF